MKGFSTLEALDFSLLGQRVLAFIESMPQPVIGVINGFALGGGCEVAMACDLLIAADTARFGQPEVNLGIILDTAERSACRAWSVGTSRRNWSSPGR